MACGLREQILKGHAMQKKSRKNPIELAELILKHDPYASTEQIAEIISDWGNLFDDQRMSCSESVATEPLAPKVDTLSRSERSNGRSITYRH